MILRVKYGWCLKDLKIRKLYTANNEIMKNLLRCLLRSKNHRIFSYKLYFTNLFYSFSFNSAISRYRTSCPFSNNGKVIFRDFKISRSFCKSYASNGYLLGSRKASF